MASSTQHATIGRNTTTSTDVARNNSCFYYEDGKKYAAQVLNAGTSGISVDLNVILFPGRPAVFRGGVVHSIDHSTRSWDFV